LPTSPTKPSTKSVKTMMSPSVPIPVQRPISVRTAPERCRIWPCIQGGS
jgi:hypothetical protein